MPRTDDAPEATLTIEPPPFSSIPGRKARIVRCIALTLRSKEKSQSSSEQSRTLPWWTKPAQLNRMSIGPTSPRQRRDRLWERTSSLRRSASSPARPSRSMSVATTRAPSSRKALAVARPMPAAAAVRTATLPANRPAIENAPFFLIHRNPIVGRCARAACQTYCQSRGNWHRQQRRSDASTAFSGTRAPQ